MRHRDGRIHAYAVGAGLYGTLEPAAVFQPRDGDKVVASGVWQDLERGVYTTLNRVVCLARAGDLMWASDFEPHSDVRHGHQPGCALSLDGRTVWVYRPDAGAGTSGSCTAPSTTCIPWTGGPTTSRRTSPSTTIPTGRALHPPRRSLRVRPEESFVEWSGGYLTEDTAVVVLGGESEDEKEWFRYHLVDVRTGTLSGEFAVEVGDPYELVPLGDGSWLTGGLGGGPVRWSRAPQPSAPPRPAVSTPPCERQKQ